MPKASGDREKRRRFSQNGTPWALNICAVSHRFWLRRATYCYDTTAFIPKRPNLYRNGKEQQNTLGKVAHFVCFALCRARPLAPTGAVSCRFMPVCAVSGPFPARQCHLVPFGGIRLLGAQSLGLPRETASFLPKR